MAKPTSKENYALFTAIARQELDALLLLTRKASECGCHVVESRASNLGQLSISSLLVSGTWDAIAKLEASAPKLERDGELQVHIVRTEPRDQSLGLLPYAVEVISADRPGILQELIAFFVANGISIEQLNSGRYKAPQTGTDIFSAQLVIGIPSRMHLAALRDEFMELCDALNLDAIMDPLKG